LVLTSGEGTARTAQVDRVAGTVDRTAPRQPTVYHGSVDLETVRLIPGFSKVVEEVIQHLTGLPGAKVKVSIEIAAEIPNGAPDHVVRTVTENGRALKFKSQDFDDE